MLYCLCVISKIETGRNENVLWGITWRRCDLRNINESYDDIYSVYLSIYLVLCILNIKKLVCLKVYFTWF